MSCRVASRGRKIATFRPRVTRVGSASRASVVQVFFECPDQTQAVNIACMERGLEQFWPSVVSPSQNRRQDRLQGTSMATPKEMDVVRRAYELWQQAGEPSGKDDEFYHQAKKELQEALDKEQQPWPA